MKLIYCPPREGRRSLIPPPSLQLAEQPAGPFLSCIIFDNATLSLNYFIIKREPSSIYPIYVYMFYIYIHIIIIIIYNYNNTDKYVIWRRKL